MKINVENAEHINIQDPRDIWEIIQRIFYQKKGELDLMKEHLWAFSLNKARKILNIELVSMGSKDRTVIDPGDIFRVPLYKSSSYVILVHNHPSGRLKPSDTDIEITNKIIKAGELLDIKVLDHVIVSDKSFFSFELTGLIEQLREDNKYALTFVYKKKMERKMEALKANVEREKKKFGIQKLKEGVKKGLKEGKKERDREIARNLLLQGVDTKIIEASTGLTKQWIGRIKNELEKPEKSS